MNHYEDIELTISAPDPLYTNKYSVCERGRSKGVGILLDVFEIIAVASTGDQVSSDRIAKCCISDKLYIEDFSGGKTEDVSFTASSWVDGGATALKLTDILTSIATLTGRLV